MVTEKCCLGSAFVYSLHIVELKQNNVRYREQALRQRTRT